MKIKKILFLLIMTFALTSQANAQVTIGTGESPVSGALLQLKDKDNVTDGSVNANKGIALPRVILSDKNQLYPMFLVDPANPASGPNATYQANKAALDKSHIGLIVYNLAEDADKGVCAGLNEWDGEEWSCFQQGRSNAVIDQIFFDEIKVYGNYVKGYQTTPSEYIVLPMDVKKPGTYMFTINAMYNASAGNGYSFTATGEFLFAGKQYVTLVSQGIPTETHFDASDRKVGDNIQIVYNGDVVPSMQTSNITIPVAPPLADFSIYCGSYKVNGIYTVSPDKTNSDDNTHYIDIDVNVVGTTNGSGWSAVTDTQNGLSFKGSGIFTTAGRQTIRLYANPGSRANTFDPITLALTAETLNGSSKCNVTVRPAFTRKKIAGFGTANNGWGYNGNAGGSRRLLLTNQNFGNAANSTVPMVASNKPTPLGRGTSSPINVVTDYNAFEYINYFDMSTANLQKAIDAKPDMIMLGYDHTWTAATAQIALKYLNNGGVIIDMTENTSPSHILNAIFGVTGITTEESTGRAYSQLAAFTDPILNGPFQLPGENSLGGQYVAADTENRLFGYKNLPANGILIYAYNKAGNPSIIRTLGQRYLLISDGGFITDNDDNIYTSQSIEPFAINENGIPVLRPATGGNYTVPLVNSLFFANAVAWAVNEAQYNGVNSK